jgi:hypothetical protein
MGISELFEPPLGSRDGPRPQGEKPDFSMKTDDGNHHL